MKTFAPETSHAHLIRTAPLAMAFDPARDYQTWRQEVGDKLRQLIGLLPERVPPNIKIEYEEDHDLFREKRFVFTSEAAADVPCHLLTPKGGHAPFPIVICLQGHTTGMHISLGRARSPGDETSISEGDHDYALQAVRQGYAALVMEQRCFGERGYLRPAEVQPPNTYCHHASMTALLLGRTMIGERVWDVSRAIDVLTEFPEVDTDRIGCMGNSGGGTITYFATCLEPRIGIAMPSCFVCTFRDSIASMYGCADNYIPGVLRYFEMGDVACLIAPRPLVVVAGREDTSFPIHGVEETFATIQGIYAAAGVPDRCRLVIGEGDHRFYAARAWPVFNELAGW